jgi:hypothetical protein
MSHRPKEIAEKWAGGLLDAISQLRQDSGNPSAGSCMSLMRCQTEKDHEAIYENAPWLPYNEYLAAIELLRDILSSEGIDVEFLTVTADQYFLWLLENGRANDGETRALYLQFLQRGHCNACFYRVNSSSV